MRIGLDTLSYRCAAGLWEYIPRDNAPMTAYHFLRKAAELNLDGVHLRDPRHLDSLEYGYVSSLREEAERLGLYLELGSEGTNPDHLETMVRTAHVAGAPLVRTALAKERPAGAAAMDAMLARAANDLRQVVPVCERYGIALTVENRGELTAGELLALVDLVGSDAMGVSLDTAASLLVLEDPMEAAGTLAPVLRSLHLRDCQLAARAEGFAVIGCALGEGVLDLPGILDLVAAQAPEASVNIAAHSVKQFVPALEEDYLLRLPRTSASELGRALRQVRDRGLPREPRLPHERGLDEGEVLAEEDDLLVHSAAWARQATRRSESDM